MNDRPFTSFANPNGDGFHNRTAAFLSVAGRGIEMLATKTERAMVPMLTSSIIGKDHLTAVTTTKWVIYFVLQFDDC